MKCSTEHFHEPAPRPKFFDEKILSRRRFPGAQNIEGTKSAINITREKFGLPLTEENPPRVFLKKDTLEKLQAEQKELEKQKEELVSQQEKERLIREEKEKKLQEKLDELFRKFERLNSRYVESKSMGFLVSEVA